MATREPTPHDAFFALWCLTNEKHSETLYHALLAARDVVIERMDFEVAASLNDLRKVLTSNFQPKQPTSDELAAAAGL